MSTTIGNFYSQRTAVARYPANISGYIHIKSTQSIGHPEDSREPGSPDSYRIFSIRHPHHRRQPSSSYFALQKRPTCLPLTS